MPAPADGVACRCDSGLAWGQCCGRILAGIEPAASAEALMRSRFSAFAIGDTGYLLRSWHRSTRPRTIELDNQRVWTRLTILKARGGQTDQFGEVEFVAQYLTPDGRGRLHELSRFERVQGRWVYVDGQIDP